MTDVALGHRLHELEALLQGQAREIRALEKIEHLQERAAELEAANRALEARVAELHTFLTLSKTLAATLNPEELFRLALHLIGRALHVDGYAVMLLDEPGEHLVVKAAFGLPEEEVDRFRIRRGEGISGLVAQTGQPMLIPDVNADPRFREAALFGAPQGAFLCVPLRLKGREVIGVLTAQKPGPRGFSLADLDLFQAVANQVAAALENAQLYQRTKELSTRDELTGLFNRRHFFDHLEREIQRARRYRRVFALLMCDLDGFKAYNDTHGHVAGDAVLKEVAALLRASTRRADTVARFGGDEFVILLPEIPKPRATLVAEKIRGAIETHTFATNGATADGKLTFTCGVAAYPGDAEEGLELLDRADQTLYVGKQAGGNRVIPAGDLGSPLTPAPGPDR
jgi:diguanylate cyclase (GGDEF)-like protein